MVPVTKCPRSEGGGGAGAHGGGEGLNRVTYELEMERQDEGARPRGRCEAVEGEALGMGVQAMCLMVPLVIIGGESESTLR